MKLVFETMVLIHACHAALGQLGSTYTDKNKDFIANGCQNFNFSLSDKAYLPSEVISISGSCEDTEDTRALCPSWNVTSRLVEVKFLRNHTVRDGTTCTRIMEVQVLNFRDTTKRVQLLVEFDHPRSEPIKEINVERSDDGKHCRQSRDCYYSDQFCSSSGICTCSDEWIFIRNNEKCFPAINRIKGQCKYWEQCQMSNSMCQYSGCECVRLYRPNSNLTQCLPEASGYGSSCSTDENCMAASNRTVCKNGSCNCRDGYTYTYENERGCISNGAACFSAGFGWKLIVSIILLKLPNLLLKT